MIPSHFCLQDVMHNKIKVLLCIDYLFAYRIDFMTVRIVYIPEWIRNVFLQPLYTSFVSTLAILYLEV
jgi:hypothetical protein